MRSRTAVTLLVAMASLALFPRSETETRSAVTATTPAPQGVSSASRQRVRVATPATPGTTAATPSAESAPRVAPTSRAAVGPGRHLVLTNLPARPGDPGAIARDLLAENGAALGLDGMPGELVLVREFDSLAGRHVRFQQAVGGVPVFGSQVSAHVTSAGRPLLLAADVFPLAEFDPLDVTPRVSSAAALGEALAVVRDEDDPADSDDPADADARFETSAPRLTILPEGKRGSLAWRVDVRTPDESVRVFVDAIDGTALAVHDLRVAADGRALLFDPNPVNSEGNASFRDQADKDSGGLTAARQLVTLPRLDGTGFLRGEWVDVTPSPVLAFEPDLDWTWVTRSHHVFEQVMAYYHIDRTQDRLRALGLTNVVARQQDVNAHATTSDQSFFDTSDLSVNFGDGGVDDGEDGDVIVHEYGHAIQHDQVEDFGATNEGGAMGEGFSDWLAVMMHLSARPAWDPLFASWDGTALTKHDPPYLRRVNRNKRYPGDVVDQVHDDGEIWSRFLWDLHLLIGRDEALRVVIESHFLLHPNARFGFGTDALLVTNAALRDGRDDASIRALAEDRGLPFTVPPAPLPDEEAWEDNDSPAAAATLPPGEYERFLLADDDWFRLVVAPYRRLLVRSAFDPAAMDMALTVVDDAGIVVAAADGAAGFEELEVMAADAPRILFLRCHHAGSRSFDPAAYDLTITEVDLETIASDTTAVRKLEPAGLLVFRVAVAPAKVDAGAALRVRTRRRGGPSTEMRALRPGGEEWAGWEATRKRRGAKARIDVDESGDWIFAVRPRKTKASRYVLNVRLR